MNKRLIGRVTYYVTWPGIFLVLLATTRTRILVLCNNEVLLARSWLGNSRWQMIGGGLNRGEDPAVGACRELFEEVGIQAKPADLKFVHKAWTPSAHRFRYRYYAYVLELADKPKLTLDTHEIADAQWFSVKTLDDHPFGTLRDVWAAWKNKK